MDFTELDLIVDRRIEYVKNALNEEITEHYHEAKHKIEKRFRRAHMDFRTFTHLEKHPPYGFIGRFMFTKNELTTLLMRVPNTHLVDITQKMGHYSISITIEIYSTFNERFKTNAQLEAEYEFDVIYLIDNVKYAGLGVDVKFFHYYL